MTETRHAVVIGAGIAGLASAIALTRAEWRVTLVEQAKQIRADGSGIVISRNGLAALDALGVGERVRDAGVQTRVLGSRTQFGTPLIGAGQTDASDIVGLHRTTLLHILKDAASDVQIERDATAVSVTDGASPSVTTVGDAGEQRHAADLIVGADGIDSVVRSAVFSRAVTDYSGASAWRGVSPRLDSTPDGFVQILGRGTEFGLLPIDGDRVYWYGMFPARAGTTAPDEREAALAMTRAWAGPLHAHIEATERRDVLRHDLRYLATGLGSYVRGRTVLVGDAAHAMVPTLGQGASQGLEDAATLGVLAGLDNLDLGLTRYDEERLARTQRLQRLSLSVLQSTLRTRGPVCGAVRNGAASLTPSWLAEWGTDVLLDWRVPTKRRRPN